VNNYKHFNLEQRFIEFSLLVMKIVDKLPKTYVGQHFARQLIRSGTSPSFQYGEAQGAESRKDFIHKLKIGLKELKETKVCLTLIKKHPLLTDPIVQNALNECDQLIAITFKSISTAQVNLKNDT
jgi:four helix bundle protein